MPTAYTNQRGRFLIKMLTPGTYQIVAEKLEDGYPTTRSPFYSAGFVQVPVVEVYEQQTTADVAVRLAPKATKLTARVLDATTNQPVEDVRMILSRVDNPEYSRMQIPDVNGKVHVLLPPTPVTIKVSAPGYKDWHHWEASPSETEAAPSQRKPSKKLTIFLEPAS